MDEKDLARVVGHPSAYRQDGGANDPTDEEAIAELREHLAAHCACTHDGRGNLESECQEHEEQRLRAEKAEAALVALQQRDAWLTSEVQKNGPLALDLMAARCEIDRLTTENATLVAALKLACGN